MYPIIYRNEYFAVPTWHICFLLGTVSAYLYFQYLTKKFYSEFVKYIPSLFLNSYIGALLGGRLLSCIAEQEDISFVDFFRFDSLTFYGGFIGACIFTHLYFFIKKLPIKVFWDLMIPPLFLGLSIGRLGCFFNGDDFGIPVDLQNYDSVPWWAVSFPNHFISVPRYPVQLIESGYALLICLLGGLSFQHIHFHRIGLLGSLSILAYACCRFVLEFYRDDERGWMIFHWISTSQGISLCLATGIIIHYFFSWYFGKHTTHEVLS